MSLRLSFLGPQVSSNKSNSKIRNYSSLWKNHKPNHNLKKSKDISDISKQRRNVETNSLSLRTNENSQNMIRKSASNSNALRLSMANDHKTIKPNKSLKRGNSRRKFNEGGTTTRLGFTSTLQETLNSIEMYDSFL